MSRLIARIKKSRIIPILLIIQLCMPGVVWGADYAIGADLSYLKQVEDEGRVFKDNGQAGPGLEIFRNHGYNWVRLRLFHTPTRLPNDLKYTLSMANDARQKGYRFLLDFHYSDTWADPGEQCPPKAWKGKSHEELVQAVFEYTRDTLIAFRRADLMPDMVQIGNEVTNGILWPDGKLPDKWDNFADLLTAGIRGVRTAVADKPCPAIMIHIDQGGNKERTRYFFDKLKTYGVEYDVIGQSYYPWWHGSLLDLRENLYFMAKTYQKDIIIVETAYHWRTAQYKNGLAPFPETPDGQRQFLEAVNREVLSAPDNRGKGVFWWESAVSSHRAISGRGMFDDEGNVLPVISVFDRWALH